MYIRTKDYTWNGEGGYTLFVVCDEDGTVLHKMVCPKGRYSVDDIVEEVDKLGICPKEEWEGHLFPCTKCGRETTEAKAVQDVCIKCDELHHERQAKLKASGRMG